jgi:transcription antitermination factor NusG
LTLVPPSDQYRDTFPLTAMAIILPPDSAATHGTVDNPASAFPFTAPGDWFVLHTRSRQEKALAEELDARHLHYFLPLRKEIRYHGKRKCVVQAALFSNYLFLKGSREDAFLASRTKRVANIIPVPDQHRIQSELANIHLALLQDAPFTLYPSLVKGLRVEVRAGPFRGLQGIIEDRTKANRLILQFETLGRAVAFEIDASLLDVIDG